MQTIIGSNGTIGRLLAPELRKYTSSIRLVARNPKALLPDAELVKADVLDANQMDHAVAGSMIVYFTIGFDYSYKVWKEKWPKAIDLILRLCQKHKAKLVFFDNMYMYAPEAIHPAREDARIGPSSKKGHIRMLIAEKIQEAHKNGWCETLIARAPDFYGPGIEGKSLITETIVKNVLQGKKAMWMGNPHLPHACIYTPDAARAVALLGNSPEAFRQVWHLPTKEHPPTGAEWVALFAKAAGRATSFRVMGKGFIGFLGIFIPFMREMKEMLYFNTRPFTVDCSKFLEHFPFECTSYEQGVEEIIKAGG
jgi:nucleoside-diphosphate-sugar epimerase